MSLTNRNRNLNVSGANSAGEHPDRQLSESVEALWQPMVAGNRINIDGVSNRRNDSECCSRTCWICYCSEDDDRMAIWVQPCKCRGTTKWVHQSCLYRWIDEKQNGNALRPVKCQQCQTEYIMIFPKLGVLANVLEYADNLIMKASPFIAAGILFGSIYWIAVTYGAVTFLQVVGQKKGMALMENGYPVALFIGLPTIPIALILSRLIRWEEPVLRFFYCRSNIIRKFPLLNLIWTCNNHEDPPTRYPSTPDFSDPISATHVVCGGLILPTISILVGRLLFDSIENSLYKTVLGGLTYLTVKGIFKIYLRHQQYNRRTKRRIVDYNEENARHFTNRGGHNARHHPTPPPQDTANQNPLSHAEASTSNGLRRSPAIQSFTSITDEDETIFAASVGI